MILSRILKMRKTAKINTQKVRENMLDSLQKLFSLAKQQAQNQKLNSKQRQKRIRVASYVAQVINSLSKSFDEAAMTKDLEELERMISEAMAKTKDKETQTTTEGTSRS